MGFRAARHADLYLTVVVALVLGVLGVFDVVDAGVLAAATLTTLGVLALSLLNGRVQMHRLAATTAELTAHLDGRVPAGRVLAVSRSGADVDLDHARDIRIVGVTLGRTLRNHVGTLQRRLDEGAVVRIALIAPGGEAVREAARRSAVGDTPEIFEHRLGATRDLLRRLSPGPGRLEIRELAFVPSFGMIAVDPQEAGGHLHVDIYSHRTGCPEPALTLEAARDARWYRHFADEFDQIWSAGRPVGTDQVEDR